LSEDNDTGNVQDLVVGGLNKLLRDIKHLKTAGLRGFPGSLGFSTKDVLHLFAYKLHEATSKGSY